MTPTVQQVGFKVSYTMVPQGEIDESLLSFIYIFYIYFCGQQIRLAMDLAIYDVYIYIQIYIDRYVYRYIQPSLLSKTQIFLSVTTFVCINCLIKDIHSYLQYFESLTLTATFYKICFIRQLRGIFSRIALSLFSFMTLSQNAKNY